MYDNNKSTSETISWEKLLRQLYVFDGKRWLKNPNLLPTLFLISSRILAEVAFLGGAAISDLPLFAKRPRRIFPTSLTDDVWQMMVWIVFGRPVALKIGKLVFPSVTLKLKLSRKMSYIPDWWRKLHFCYLWDGRFYQLEARVFQNFFLRWDLTFPVKRGIKLPISARHWHVLVARFS